MAKAILLLSGGLDSTLTGKLLLTMGVEVEAVNFTSPFCCCTPKGMGCSAARQAADQLGIPVKTFACASDYLQVIKHPRFGRGSGMNACIDCRIHMFTRAREYMLERNADFVATGEVLGERPMSQHRRAMDVIERESGLTGRLVRPLCAQLLPPTLPEQEGLVDRNQFKAMQGRQRQPQFTLAAELGVKDYLCPAGGCLLADREIAARFEELLDHKPDFDMGDAHLLRLGRHFRLPGGAKAVVGRNEQENNSIEQSARTDDILLLPKDIPGPSVLCRGQPSQEDTRRAAALLVTYTTKRGPRIDVIVRAGAKDGDGPPLENVQPIDKETAAQWRIGAPERAQNRRTGGST